MTLDPHLRRQLLDAREALGAEIDEVECRAAMPFRAAPDYRDSYAALHAQLREIDALLGDGNAGTEQTRPQDRGTSGARPGWGDR